MELNKQEHEILEKYFLEYEFWKDFHSYSDDNKKVVLESKIYFTVIDVLPGLGYDRTKDISKKIVKKLMEKIQENSGGGRRRKTNSRRRYGRRRHGRRLLTKRRRIQ
jgi:hypothetical protein